MIEFLNEKFYEKWFGGRCVIERDCYRMQYIIKIKNDDIGRMDFYIPREAIRNENFEEAFQIINENYITQMKLRWKYERINS